MPRGGTSNSGNLVSLYNIPGATEWIVMQNATSGNLCQIATNSGGIGIQPKVRFGCPLQTDFSHLVCPRANQRKDLDRFGTMVGFLV